jgi:hypothetical protein
MGLFDSYFDPDQFQDSGGLIGRLQSLQGMQGLYQPGAGFAPQTTADGSSAPPMSPTVAMPGAASTPATPQTPDDDPTQNIAIGNYQMPQFGRADVSQAAPSPPPPDLGDRLSAGLQSWAHTPVGNPFAALANGVTGFNSGQRTDAAGASLVPSTPQTSAQAPGLGDRLSAGLQSWAHTPVGNPFAALANGVTGFSSGQPVNTSAAAPKDLNAQYQALRRVLGDHNAMLAIVHPETGRALIAQALARQAKAGG